MASMRINKSSKAQKQLKQALEIYEKSKENQDLFFLTVVKAFEVLIEYSWKELKIKVEDEGLEAPSPKEVVRQAAKIGLIENPELWLKAINARNLSVHDYFSLPEDDYLELCREFLRSR